MESKFLWQEYHSGDSDARERLLKRYLPLVHHVAGQVHRVSGPDTEFHELVSAGTIGLMHAVESFDLDRGVAFSTYAVPRIRGAILDDQRRRDPVPRSIRRKKRDLDRARKAATRKLRRPPRRDETARELGISLDTLTRWERQMQQAFPVSLDHPTGPASEGLTLQEVVSRDRAVEIEDYVNRKEEAAILRDALMELPEQQRVVLSLYYLDELKIQDIAKILGVTPSRVSQIHLAGVRSLQASLGHLRESAA